MTVELILEDLKTLGSEQTKKIFQRHGAREPFFGVKVSDLKRIVKKVKTNHQLSLDLYNTGNSDAMYLAGLICDPSKFSKPDLQHWVEHAYWYMLSEYTVASAAAESHFGWKLASEWIHSDKEMIQSAGWSTYSNLVSIIPNKELNDELISDLLKQVELTIHQSMNRVRYTMNGFVIAVGVYIPEFKKEALEVAEMIGKVSVFMGETSCKVPSARPYIEKVYSKGTAGKKRKRAIC